MADQSKYNPTFTAQDIERYYSGTMTTKEMHALEKAALDDPFLADALEGYAYTKQPASDIKDLRKRLDERTEKTKVILMGNKRDFSIAWKAAAMIILVLGLGWAIYQFSFTSKENDLAITGKKTETTSTPVQDEATTKTENTSADIKSTTVDEQNEKDLSSTVKSTTNPKRQINTVRNKEEFQTTSINAEKKVSGYVAGIKTNAEEGVTTAPSASIQDGVNQESSDARKRYTINDTAAEDNVAQFNTRNRNVIVLQRSPDNQMQEVVVGKSIPDSLRRKPNITFTNVEPEEGTQYYDDYVAQNLTVPDEIKTKPNGEVELSFELDASGNAINIKVEKSLCEACDKEAIRLVEKGPKLKKKNRQKGKLKIRFQ